MRMSREKAPACVPELFFFLLLLSDRDVYHAGSHHAEGARGRDRQIDDPAANEGAAIVDAALN